MTVACVGDAVNAAGAAKVNTEQGEQRSTNTCSMLPAVLLLA